MYQESRVPDGQGNQSKQGEPGSAHASTVRYYRDGRGYTPPAAQHVLETRGDIAANIDLEGGTAEAVAQLRGHDSEPALDRKSKKNSSTVSPINSDDITSTFRNEYNEQQNGTIKQKINVTSVNISGETWAYKFEDTTKANNQWDNFLLTNNQEGTFVTFHKESKKLKFRIADSDASLDEIKNKLAEYCKYLDANVLKDNKLNTDQLLAKMLTGLGSQVGVKVVEANNIDFANFNLKNVDLAGANFDHCSFKNVHITGDFSNAHFTNCQVSDCRFYILKAEGLVISGKQSVWDHETTLKGTLAGADISGYKFRCDINGIYSTKGVNWNCPLFIKDKADSSAKLFFMPGHAAMYRYGYTLNFWSGHATEGKKYSGSRIEQAMKFDASVLKRSATGQAAKLIDRMSEIKKFYEPDSTIDEKKAQSKKTAENLSAIIKNNFCDPYSAQLIKEIFDSGKAKLPNSMARKDAVMASPDLFMLNGEIFVVQYAKSSNNSFHTTVIIDRLGKNKDDTWEIVGTTGHIAPEVADLALHTYAWLYRQDDKSNLNSEKKVVNPPLEGEIVEEKGLQRTGTRPDDIIDAEFEIKRDPDLLKEAQRQRIGNNQQEQQSNNSKVIFIPPTGPEQIAGGESPSNEAEGEEKKAGESLLSKAKRFLGKFSRSKSSPISEESDSDIEIDIDPASELQEQERSEDKSESTADQNSTKANTETTPGSEAGTVEATAKESLLSKVKNSLGKLKTWILSFRKNSGNSAESDQDNNDSNFVLDSLQFIGDSAIYLGKGAVWCTLQLYKGAQNVYSSAVEAYAKRHASREASIEETSTTTEATRSIPTLEEAQAFISEHIAERFKRASNALVKFTKDLDFESLKERSRTAKANLLYFTDNLFDSIRENFHGLEVKVPTGQEEKAKFRKENSILLKAALPDYVYVDVKKMFGYSSLQKKLEEQNLSFLSRKDGVIGVKNGNNLLRFEETQSGKIRVHIKLDGGDWQKLGSMYLVEGDNGKLSDPEILAKRFMKADFSQLSEDKNLKKLLGISGFKETDTYIIPKPLQLS